MTDECIVAVVPALNEERTIGDVVSELYEYTDDVIVIDDGSADETAGRARDAGAIVCEHETNRGYDRSINDGFARASEVGATIVFTFDADGQHYAEDIPVVIEPIRTGEADVVVGRRLKKARASESLFSLYTRFRLGVVDPLCGFKAYRIEVYDDVGFFDRASTIGTQLMLEAKKHGYEVAQVDVHLGEREDEPRFGRRLEANWKILRAMGRLCWADLTTIRPGPN